MEENIEKHNHDEHVQDHAQDHHAHNHAHHHDHALDSATSQEETLALLAYMVSHNKHHAEELEKLATEIKGEAEFHLQNAIGSFKEGNEELEKALKLLQKGN